MTLGRETVTFFELDLPRCLNTYGVTPCAAVLGTTGALKCYNTRITCQDVANYNPGSLTLRFGNQSESLLDSATDYGYVIPSLLDVRMTPATINLAGMDPSSSPLGQRESVTIKLQDHQHSDLLVDPYRLERITGAASSPSDPFDPSQRGTFWRKWLARNPFYTAYPGFRVRIRRGYIGQALEDMSARTYLIDRIEFDDDGVVTIVCKDLFGKLEDRKAVAPAASPGELDGAISAAAGSATLAPAGIGNSDYPSSGYARIGNEVVAFTRAGDVMTLTQRGALRTDADDHEAGDTVQLVLVISAQQAHAATYSLLTDSEYGPFSTSDIDLAEWSAAATAAGMVNLYTAYITEPTAISKLVAELSEQARFTIYADPESGQIKFVPLVASAAAFRVNDDAWIIDGSLSIERQDTKRISQVWVYFGQLNPTKNLEDVNNFAVRYRAIAADAEGPTQYGSASIKKIYSRWIPQTGLGSATETGDGNLFMFQNPPIEAQFSVHKSRLDVFRPAALFELETDLVQDVTGQDAVQVHAVISIALDENRVRLKSQQTFFAEPNAARKIFFVGEYLGAFNMRTEHDKLYVAPTGSETVQVILMPGAVLASTSVGSYALRTGTWPAGTTLEMEISSSAEMWGKAGAGGDGGDCGFNSPSHPGVFFADPGLAGQDGGPAFLAERAITITSTGTINGGCPGGGGAGSALDDGFAAAGGSSGGGGQGPTPGGPGAVGGVWNIIDAGRTPGLYKVFGNPGSSGTYTAPGVGGVPASVLAQDGVNSATSGQGGNGATPTASGTSGTSGSFTSTGMSAIGGTPGARGAAVDGDSFITWVSTGTINGAVNP